MMQFADVNVAPLEGRDRAHGKRFSRFIYIGVPWLPSLDFTASLASATLGRIESYSGSVRCKFLQIGYWQKTFLTVITS
jgi:hypothetical protein